jgi:hypothetical protein
MGTACVRWPADALAGGRYRQRHCAKRRVAERPLAKGAAHGLTAFTYPKANQKAPTRVGTETQTASWKATLKINCPCCGEAYENSTQIAGEYTFCESGRPKELPLPAKGWPHGPKESVTSGRCSTSSQRLEPSRRGSAPQYDSGRGDERTREIINPPRRPYRPKFGPICVHPGPPACIRRSKQYRANSSNLFSIPDDTGMPACTHRRQPMRLIASRFRVTVRPPPRTSARAWLRVAIPLASL